MAGGGRHGGGARPAKRTGGQTATECPRAHLFGTASPLARNGGCSRPPADSEQPAASNPSPAERLSPGRLLGRIQVHFDIQMQTCTHMDSHELCACVHHISPARSHSLSLSFAIPRSDALPAEPSISQSLALSNNPTANAAGGEGRVWRTFTQGS